MTEHALRFRKRISRRSAHEMIQLFAKHGNHYNDVAFRTDADVKRAFQRQGVDYDRLVHDCRDVTVTVPFFENLLGSTWNVLGGAKVSRVDLESGDEDLQVQGPGTYTSSAYWATFETADGARLRAVEQRSFSELHSAIVHGIASIEGYIKQRAEAWNKMHPSNPLEDSRQKKVSFDEKIDGWIPRMTGGRKLDKGGTIWRHFRKLQGIRDDMAIHPKVTGYSISLGDLAELINMLRTGVAGVLIDLHSLFDEKVPGKIIRARYAPDVEVIALGGPGEDLGAEAR